MQQQGAWIWTRRQRATLAVIVLILAVAFLVRAMRSPARIADPPPPAGDRAAELATRIDPNTAEWPAWAALPLIGEKRAKQIVAFRESWLAEHPGETPFEKPEDLMRVKGIGKATVTTLEPYLIFPAKEENKP
jgi:hypothetical protein